MHSVCPKFLFSKYKPEASEGGERAGSIDAVQRPVPSMLAEHPHQRCRLRKAPNQERRTALKRKVIFFFLL